MNAKLRISTYEEGAYWFLDFGNSNTVTNYHGYTRNGQLCVPACKREAYRIAGKLGLVITEVVYEQ